MSTQLLFQSCPEGCDPLGPENPIVFAVGPLTGLFPLASKTVTMFKSPHTGNLGESHCGGSSAVAIRMAGYGAIAIGRNEMPGYHTGPAAHVGCRMGTRHIHREKLRFKTREGFTFDGLRIPERILKTKSPASGLSED